MQILKRYRMIIYSILFICILILIGYNVFAYKKTKSIEIFRKKIVNEELPIKDNISTIDFDLLRKKYKNNDIVGAIRIKNENFERIVFNNKDNTYYMNHNFLKKKGSGEIFIENNASLDKSKIIILNTKGTNCNEYLKKYNDEQYYLNHKYIEIESYKYIYTYEVISLYSGNIDSDNIDYEDIFKKSITTYSLDLDEEDNILIINSIINNKEISIIAKKVK